MEIVEHNIDDDDRNGCRRDAWR